MLRGLMEIDSKDNKITSEKMVQKLEEYLKKALTESEVKANSAIISNLSKFKVGLFVNCGFTGYVSKSHIFFRYIFAKMYILTIFRCESFEASEDMKIFQLLKMRVLHGWIFDSSSKVLILIRLTF